MPSKEEYLDGLLREMSEEKEEDRREDAGEEHSPDIDTVSGMSEEEIAKLLAAGANHGQQSYEERLLEESQKDVSDLEDSGDGDLREIQELLKKSDRNETIDTQSEGLSQEMGPADRLMEEIEAGGAEVAIGSKEQKTLEKKQRKAERTAAREAAKAEKEAKRRLKKEKKAKQKEENFSQKDDSTQGNGKKQVEEFDMLLDKDLLDSIVSGAEQVDRGDGRRTEAVTRSNESEEAEEELEPEVLTLDLEEASAYISEVPSGVRGQEAEPAKKGLLSKVVNLLMEEEEETSEGENENVQISDENQEIINALDSEKDSKGKGAGAKKKKEKAPKKKKDAKAKKNAKAKKAASKPKKPPKQKKPKEVEPYRPGSRITFKKILPILLLGLTVGAVTFLFVKLTVDFTGKQAARTAFDAGDYQGCYLNLYGKKLNDDEKVMYGKSESILYIRLWYQEYQAMVENGTEAEALDCLLQIIDDYPKLYEYALQWNAMPEVYEVYSELLRILSEKYNLTEAQAREIAAIKSDIEYTKAVYLVTEGKWQGFTDVQRTAEPAQPDIPESDRQPEGGVFEENQANGDQPDELPEESEIEGGNFVDNQS